MPTKPDNSLKSTEFTITTTQTTLPFLATLEQHKMPSSQALSLPMVRIVAPTATVESSNMARTYVSARGNMQSLAPPLLMFLQFGIAFRIQDNSSEDLGQQMVNFSIAMFAATSLMYQKFLREAQINSIAAHLLPEVTVTGVVALVFYHHLTVGFLVMISGMLLMALSVVVGSVYHLVSTSENDKAEVSLPSPVVDILVV